MELENIIHYIKCILRVLFVIANNLYCIPTYLLWTWVFFLPLRIFQHPIYWYIESMLFKWLLYMVASWSWCAGYTIEEIGDDISDCMSQRCLVLVNHQSTADVPMLMHAFQTKGSVLENVLWIMDRLFRYTNFGLVSVTHGDYFITQGKNARDVQLQRLQKHLLSVYLPRGREWIVLFPEGGFLRKRREVSQRYAKQNNFPVLEHVTLPRVGAMYLVLNTLRPGKLEEIVHKQSPQLEDLMLKPIEWVIDITIGYPNGVPLDLPTVCSASRPPCVTYMHYRRYPVEKIPLDDMKSLTDWVYNLWAEKEEMLRHYYDTGKFPDYPKHNLVDGDCHNVSNRSKLVTLDTWWIIVLNLFFISSTLYHIYLIHRIWSYVF